jgi:hypothetical protein
MDGLNFSGFMQRIKDACCGAAASASKGGAAGADAASQEEGGGASAARDTADETAVCLAFEAVANLAALLGSVGVRSCEDVRQLCAEVLPELAACSRVAKATAAGRAVGLSSGGHVRHGLERRWSLCHSLRRPYVFRQLSELCFVSGRQHTCGGVPPLPQASSATPRTRRWLRC